MITFPNAKINLGLFITEKRADGFHNIDSCFYPVAWKDVLEIQQADQLRFTSSGITIPGEAEKNLCLLAYQMLKKAFDLPPVYIHLHKVIPIGAGLGGGSADGSFALKMLNEKFQLNLSNVKLEEYAAQLGSDCPFFINNKPVLVSGRGEVFEHIDLNLAGKYIVLVNPQIHISTKEAYAGVTPKFPAISCKEILQGTVSSWKTALKNDFEESLFPNYPQLAQLKQRLYDAGARYASMTGSGSTVYGIFDEKVAFSGLANELVFSSEL
ncbi:MAG: 4-(cytidine 5'-diphospho)-2-C-methyl-D-erythritol kinase [Flammeovirgaceae bacterium]